MNIIHNAKNKLLIAYKRLSREKFSAVNCRISVFANSRQEDRNVNVKNIRGFTLIETLVAISILMVAVASPLTIAQKGLSSAIYAKDQIIASYLAQDAIEYLRNVSDRNTESGVNWLSGIKDSCGTSCNVDTSAGSISFCSSCSALKYNENSQIYSYVSGNNSPFIRVVKVEETVLDVEALITVTMSWKDKNTDRVINFHTRIYNWRS